jgi:hypothetical protein
VSGVRVHLDRSCGLRSLLTSLTSCHVPKRPPNHIRKRPILGAGQLEEPFTQLRLDPNVQG